MGGGISTTVFVGCQTSLRQRQSHSHTHGTKPAGVPANMINMVHDMEVEGITIVRTPLTQYIYDTEGMEGLRHLDAQFSGILI